MSKCSPTGNLVLSFAVCVGLSLAIGCQTWSGFGLGNPSRVPPPATGTYQPPVGYYNNNSAVSDNSAGVGVVAPNAAGLPATSLTAAAAPDSLGMPTSLPGTQIQSAAYTGVATTPNSTAATLPASASLSDAAELEQPSLKWQQ